MATPDTPQPREDRPAADPAPARLSDFDYADDGYPNSGLVRIVINLWGLFVRRWNGFWGGLFGGVALFFRTFCQCRLWRLTAFLGFAGLFVPLCMAIAALVQTTTPAIAASLPSLPKPQADPLMPAADLRSPQRDYQVLESSVRDGVLRVDVVRTSDPALRNAESFTAVWSQDAIADRIEYTPNRFAAPDGWRQDTGPHPTAETPVRSYASRPAVRLSERDLPPLAAPSDRPDDTGYVGPVGDASFRIDAEWPRRFVAGNEVTLRLNVTNTSVMPVDAARVLLTLSPLERVTDAAPLAAVVDDTLVWSDGDWTPGESRQYRVTFVPDARGLRGSFAIETAAAASFDSFVAGPAPAPARRDAPLIDVEEFDDLPVREPRRSAPTPEITEAGGWYGETTGETFDELPPDDESELLPDLNNPFGLTPGPISPGPVTPPAEAIDPPADDNLLPPDPEPETTRFQDETPVPQPLPAGRPQTRLSVRMETSTKPGGDRLVKFFITNEGGVPAEDVMLLVTLPESLAHPAGRELELGAGNLRPSETFQTQLTAAVRGTGTAEVLAAAEAANARTSESSVRVLLP